MTQKSMAETEHVTERVGQNEHSGGQRHKHSGKNTGARGATLTVAVLNLTLTGEQTQRRAAHPPQGSKRPGGPF